MLEANTAAVGSVEQIQRCPEKSIKVTNCTRILQSRRDRRTDRRTFSVVVATNRSEYSTVKRIMKKAICCLSWSSREDWSTDLCQKFRAKQPAQTSTIEPEDMITISSETIPNTEQKFVYCVFWRTMILIESFIRPHKQICDGDQTSTAYIS